MLRDLAIADHDRYVALPLQRGAELTQVSMAAYAAEVPRRSPWPTAGFELETAEETPIARNPPFIDLGEI